MYAVNVAKSCRDYSDSFFACVYFLKYYL